MTRARRTAKTGAAASRSPKLPIAVLVWKGGYDEVTRLGFTDPLEALLTAITYLRRRYNVRLTNAACDELEAITPELERLLPGGDDGDPDAVLKVLAARAQAAAPPPPRVADLGAVPVGKRLAAVPAAVFADPGAIPVALD